MPDSSGRGRVLLVDDEPAILEVFREVLQVSGFDVDCAGNGREAIERFAPSRFDAIVSDIAMPEMGGIDLLRAIRELDLDVPVVLVTGLPEVETAIQAVDLGAMRYLVKPVLPSELLESVRYACGLRRVARAQREALALEGRSQGAGDRAGLEATFARARSGLRMVFQPIVRFSSRRIVAYEALVRCQEPSLAEPLALFAAAEKLGQVKSLGRQIRARVSESMDLIRDGVRVFVNLHPLELEDEDLYTSRSLLTRHAGRVVLEISEQQPLHEVTELRARIARLRGMGYRIAVDDLGAGYAGLGSLVHLEPDIAKLDHVLIRDIGSDPVKQKIASSMLGLCDDIGVTIIAEGVETRQELAALERLGTDLFQGYVFARPGTGFSDVPVAAFDLEETERVRANARTTPSAPPPTAE